MYDLVRSLMILIVDILVDWHKLDETRYGNYVLYDGVSVCAEEMLLFFAQLC